MDEIIDFVVNLCSSYIGTTILVFASVIFALICAAKVKLTFSKYSHEQSHEGRTAAEVARIILDSNGLSDVDIARTAGNLTDHYKPSDNTVYLSDTVFNSYSVGAIGVAAHEVGHAIQHAQGYFPIRIRNFILPAAQLGSNSWYILTLLGFVFQLQLLVVVGIAFFAFTALFQLVTLPVEFNASRRALNTIEVMQILDRSEAKGAKKVLTAAAMTYVAALAVSLAQLLRLLARANRRR